MSGAKEWWQRRISASRSGIPPIVTDTLLAVAVVAIVSLIIGLVVGSVAVANVSNLYIIGIAVLAARRGMYAALLASALAFFTFDWFFVPPVGTFTVDNPSEYVALLTLLVTSVIIGQLVARVRARATAARRQQLQTELLYEVSRSALSSSRVADVYALALRRLSETLGLKWSRLLVRREGPLDVVAVYGNPPETAEDRHRLRRVVEEAQPLGVWRQQENNVRIVSMLNIAEGEASTREGGAFEEVDVPLSIESRVEGVLVVGNKRTGESLNAGEARFLQAFANQLASAIQRDRLAEERTRAEALEESDRLKSALISSVSHELKTPLTAITASASSLLAEGTLQNPDRAHELAESINRDTDRLTRLVSNLLDMSRLEAGTLHPRFEWVSIADVVSDVLDRIEPALAGRPLTVNIPAELPASPLDFVLISQVLTNLLENAVRYSPEKAGIVVSAEIVREQLRVTVFNEGSYIPPADIERLFDKFYRLSTAPGGTGLGLAIARGIIEAHHGHIWAENVGRRGVAVTFTLPSPERSDGGPILSPSSLKSAL
ncbi:MAG TPA: ATP-binding protein [Chloroflexota bacterium]|nr:ATP-binding protein [Chloroflexota bacterium]